jgi:quercetin dioxygenase-like cupin family protein
MRCQRASDAAIETAALYALGALTQSEAIWFENHLSEGCAVCSAQLATFEEVTSQIGLTAVEQSPSPEIRDRLLSGLSPQSEERPAAPARPPRQLSIRAGEGQWIELQEGIHTKLLSMNETTGMATSLVRMSAGTRLQPHVHNGVEEFLVLEGDCVVNGDDLGPGDYHRAEAGSIHQTTFTVNGTLLLLVAPFDYEFISAI